MCSKHGDYLHWKDMHWTLKGRATEETWASENICWAKPRVDIFSSKKFVGIEGCANHCEKLNSRMPSVVTFEEWDDLQKFLQRSLWDKGLGGSTKFSSYSQMSRRRGTGGTTTRTNRCNTTGILHLVNPTGQRGRTVFFSGLMGWDGRTTIVIQNQLVFVITNQLRMSG